MGNGGMSGVGVRVGAGEGIAVDTTTWAGSAVSAGTTVANGVASPPSMESGGEGVGVAEELQAYSKKNKPPVTQAAAEMGTMRI